MILFMPNGFGDMIMALPAIEFAYKNSKYKEFVVVVLTEKHGALVRFFFKEPIKILIRRDGFALADLRLYFKLLTVRSRLLVAPLVSQKILNKIFFSLLPKEVFSPLNFFKISPGRNHRLPCVLNTYSGHQVNYLKNCVAHGLGVNFDSSYYLDFGYGSKERKGDKLRLCLGMSCGALEQHKVPSAEYFAELVKFLAKKFEAEFHVIATSSDLKKINCFKGLVDSLNVEVIYHMNCSFEELSELIPSFDVGIAGMSGQGHLIGAFGIPMVVFAGVTNPRESAPYVKRAVICSHNYGCGPCYQENFLQGCGKIDCMNNIEYADVFSAINFLLENSINGVGWYEQCNKKTIPVNEVLKMIGVKNV
jgi:ADP-heptose:LPS heptosyltransferase